MNAKKNMGLATGYARRSTDMQDRSIPDQKAYVEKWAKENGYRIARWYVDDSISGTSTKGRDDFEQMITDAEAGADFRTILCYDLSRFSRGGTNETGFYLHRLRLAGVDAIFVAEGIPEGDEGELLQGVKSWQARQYSVKLSRDTIRGQISNILEKRCAPGGAPPFGYDKQHCTAAGQILRTFRWLADGSKQEFGSDGKLIRVLPRGETVKKAKSDTARFVPSSPDRIGVVKRIFDWCIEGYGARYMSARLNEEGIASPDGAKWNSAQLRRMLANPTYRGAVAWNKRTMGKLHGVGRDGQIHVKKTIGGCHNNPKDQWFVVESVHEPLVTPEVFTKAQQAMDKRRNSGGLGQQVHRSLLSGLIVCNHCGWNYRQKHTNYDAQGKRTRYRYYTDGGYNAGGKAMCRNINIPADALDAWVLAKVQGAVLGDHGGVSQAIDGFVQMAMGKQKKPDDTSGVQRELEALGRKIKATVAMLTDPAFDGLDELKTTLADLKAKRDALQARLVPATALAAPAMGETELRAWASRQFRDLAAACAGRGSFIQTRNMIHAYVDRIEIDPDAKRGVLYLPADAYAFFTASVSTQGAHGDARAGVKCKGEA